MEVRGVSNNRINYLKFEKILFVPVTVFEHLALGTARESYIAYGEVGNVKRTTAFPGPIRCAQLCAHGIYRQTSEGSFSLVVETVITSSKILSSPFFSQSPAAARSAKRVQVSVQSPSV